MLPPKHLCRDFEFLGTNRLTIKEYSQFEGSQFGRNSFDV